VRFRSKAKLDADVRPVANHGAPDTPNSAVSSWNIAEHEHKPLRQIHCAPFHPANLTLNPQAKTNAPQPLPLY